MLFLRGYIERIGIGARRILTERRHAGLPEPAWEIYGGGVLLTLRLSLPEGRTSRADLSLRQLLFPGTDDGR